MAKRGSCGGPAEGAAAAKTARTAGFHPLACRFFAATVTEFDDQGKLQLRNTAKYLRHLHEAQACTGVFVCGTSGESMSLSVAERKAVMAGWLEARAECGLSAEDFAVVVHVGVDSVVSAKELAAFAEERGADGIAAMAPSFFKPKSAVELVDFVAEVASAAPKTPCFYYHYPNITGCGISAAAFFREALAQPGRLPTLAGMKFTSCDMIDYGYVCDLDPENRLALLPGFEAQTMAYLPYHANRGAYGGISLAFSLLGRLLRRIVELAGLHGKDSVSSSDMEEALTLQRRCREFFTAADEFGWLPTTKHCLVQAGIFESDRMRLPHRQLADEQRLKIVERVLPLINEKL